MEVAGYIAMANNIVCAADDYGRDTTCLKFSCRQTDGLVADGSKRDKQNNIDLICMACRDYFWRVFGDGDTMTILCWYKMKSWR